MKRRLVTLAALALVCAALSGCSYIIIEQPNPTIIDNQIFHN